MTLNSSFWMLISTMLWQAAPAPPEPGTHLTVEREFTFMSATRVTSVEQWITRDRTWERRADAVVVTRTDLGVRWVIDSKANTYSERPLQDPKTDRPATVQTGAAKPPGDLRMAGFDYEPVFDWTVTETAQTRTIEGRSCSELRAAGDADYAETSLTLWLCPRDEQDRSPDPNPAILALIRYPSIRDFVSSQLRQRGNRVLMVLEERTDPDISPLMLTTARIKNLETGAPPAGLFELPAGAKKQSP